MGRELWLPKLAPRHRQWVCLFDATCFQSELPQPMWSHSPPAAAPLMRLCMVHFINLRWKERQRRRRTDGISRSAKSLCTFQRRDNNDSLLRSEIKMWIYQGNFPQELNKPRDGWTIWHQHLMAVRWYKQCNCSVLNFRHFSSLHRKKKYAQRLKGDPQWQMDLGFCSSMQSEKSGWVPHEGTATTIWPLQGRSCATTVSRSMEADV